MDSVDAELENQLKVAGEQLLHPTDSIDELLAVLDQVEKYLSKVDQSPPKSMLEALKPLTKALIQDSLLKHSDDDVKVSVASCISEITRITAPDAPYDEDQMRDVFQLIVSSFEDLADQSSRSYNKRASILETVSKVRSCVIMLDLECDELIVEMFEHFLKSVRDYHFESIYPSMETIMVLVLEESEEITAEMLRPLLASVKKDSEGVLPVARMLGEGVLLKSAEKLKPCLRQIISSLGGSLDMYTKVVASLCEGTTATFENNDETASGLQPANESKVEKGSVDGAHQVVKEEVDRTLDRSPKSIMSNGVNVVAKEEASVDQESSKKLDEDVNEKQLNKEDTDDSGADKLAKAESLIEQTSKKRGNKTDTVINSTEPSDSSHVEGEKEIEKDNDVKESENEEDIEVKELENEEDNTVKESDNEEDNEVKRLDNEEDNEVKKIDNDEDNEVKDSENEEDNDVKESENEEEDNDVKESENEEDDDLKESENEAVNVAQVSSPKAKESKPAIANVSSPSQSNSLLDESRVKNSRSKKKQVPQKDETVSPSKSGTPPDENRVKKAAQLKSKGSTQDDASEETADLDIKPQKQTGKKAVVVKEVKPPPKLESEDESETSSESDAKPVRKSRSNLTKQSGKKVSVGESEAKKPKQSDAKKSKQSGKKVEEEEESDSDAKPLKVSVKKGEKSKITFEEEEESDSKTKPLKVSAKKSNSKKKDDGKKRGNGKNVSQKDQANSLSSDDEMEIDSSPKPTTKSAKGDENSKDTSVNSAKRKRATGKDKVSATIKYDESLVGTKVKVWWPEDKMYYEGVVDAFYSAKKKHKVLYVDGEVETLNLKTQKWEILEEFSETPTAEAQSEEASPQIHKKKRTKTESTSQEKTKDSANKKLAGVSSSSKSKVPASKDNKSKDNSKETGKSKEDEETPRSKTASKSKGKTPQTGAKSNTNGPTKGKSGSSNVKEPEAAKTAESTKGGSNSAKKRKKRS